SLISSLLLLNKRPGFLRNRHLGIALVKLINCVLSLVVLYRTAIEKCIVSYRHKETILPSCTLLHAQSKGSQEPCDCYSIGIEEGFRYCNIWCLLAETYLNYWILLKNLEILLLLWQEYLIFGCY